MTGTSVTGTSVTGASVTGSRSDAPSYYLSAYLAPPGPRSVLHPMRHDHAVALWAVWGDRVELVTYWELERLSGQKHHDWPAYTHAAATDLLEHLLKTEGLSLADVAGIWGTPGLSTGDAIERAFGHLPVPVHSLAHLYSSLLMDTEVFSSATIVAMALDGGPDIALDAATKPGFYAGAVSRSGVVEIVPVESPGPLYLAAESVFGREPGTLMALAGASDATIDADPRAVAEAGAFLAGADVYRLSRGLVAGLLERARRSLATPRARGGGALSLAEHEASAVMKVVQRASEMITERNVERLLATFDVDPTEAYLGMSGGSALNCPTNSLLMRRFAFRGLLAPPCPNDSGQALGLGLLGLVAERLLPGRDFRLGHAFRGPAQLDVGAALAGWSPWIAATAPFDAATFCRDVIAGPLAWVDGRAEIGPRALGHRSLLADPRTQATKDALNELKGRQWWRPVAPLVLAERVGEWFVDGRRSPYMLETFDVRPERRDAVPAIAHLDGSARVQTLAAADDPRLHGALRAFEELTGVPMLCNTSLNDKGEPIVATAAEALNFCVRKGIRVVYLDGLRVALRPAGAPPPAAPAGRAEWLFAGQEKDRDQIWRDWEARGVGAAGLYAMTRAPELQALADGPRLARHLRAAVAAASRHSDFGEYVERFVEDWGPGSTFRLRWNPPDDPAPVETSAVETSAVETSAVETSAVETSAVEPSAAESSAIEPSAVGSSAVEPAAVSGESPPAARG